MSLGKTSLFPMPLRTPDLPNLPLASSSVSMSIALLRGTSRRGETLRLLKKYWLKLKKMLTMAYTRKYNIPIKNNGGIGMINRTNKGQFPKGVLSTPKPIQKGQHISAATEFKKGMIPQNKLPVGSETIRTHKGDYPRAWIKVKEPNVWVMKSVYLWLSAGYEIPQGCVIHHINKNSLDDRLENLCLLTRAAHRLIHDEELKNGKTPGQELPLKRVVCTVCDSKFQGKAQRKNSLCPQCAKERHIEQSRSYKKRLRAKIR